MFLQQHQQQQQQLQCGNHWVDYQGNNPQPNYHTPNVINPHQTTSMNQDNASRTFVYQGNYSGGPENGCEHFYYNSEGINQTQPHIYDNGLNNVNNNQMMNNFVNQNEIVNNGRCFSAEEENIHKRKFDSIEEKEELLEDDEDQSPTIPINNENSRNAKRVKKSLSSVLANLQVSEDTKPQTSSACTQLMCYNENTNQTPLRLSSTNQPALIDESVNDILRKKFLSSIMNQTNRNSIADPRTDLILQSTNAEEDDNQTAVVLYRDVIGRDEVLLRLLGQQNDTSQTNQMSDE